MDAQKIKKSTLVIIVDSFSFSFDWGIVTGCLTNNAVFNVWNTKGDTIPLLRHKLIPMARLNKSYKKYKTVEEAVRDHLPAIMGKLIFLNSDKKHRALLPVGIVKNTFVVVEPKAGEVAASYPFGIAQEEPANGFCDVLLVEGFIRGRLGLSKIVKIDQTRLIPVMQLEGDFKKPDEAVEANLIQILLTIATQTFFRELCSLYQLFATVTTRQK